MQNARQPDPGIAPGAHPRKQKPITNQTAISSWLPIRCSDADSRKTAVCIRLLQTETRGGGFYRCRLIEKNIQDDAAANRDQYIIAAGSYPVITPGWRTQAAAAPIINHILSAAIFSRKIPAFAQIMPWAGAALLISPIVLCVNLIFTVIGLKATATVFAVITGSSLLISAVIVVATVTVTLGKGGTGYCQTYCHDRRNNCFSVHISPR